MRPHAVYGIVFVAGCSAFEAEPKVTSSDAAAELPDGAASDAGADQDATNQEPFCRTKGSGATLCEDFDEKPPLEGWDVTQETSTSFTLDATSWLSPPHAGRLLLERSAQDSYFNASRRLGWISVIDVELDFMKKGGSERIFELSSVNAESYAQFDTHGNIELYSQSTGLESRTLTAPSAPSFGGSFVHVHARIDLANRKVTYLVGPTTCFDGDLPQEFTFDGEVKFQLASIVTATGRTDRVEMLWDNIVVRTQP